MANNPAASWWLENDEDEQEKKESAKDRATKWDYYRWAGQNEWLARTYGESKDPSFMTDAELDKYSRLAGASPISSEDPITPRQQVATIGEERSMTPGEKLAAILGIGLEATGLVPLSGYAKMLRPEPGSTGGINTERMAAADFIRSAGISGPQTIANIAGSITDVVTGNTGKGQDYTLMGNKPQQYYDPGGAAQVIGSFAPDIAMGAGAFKLGARALTGLASRSLAGEASGLAGRIGAWAAAGSEAPTALKLGGRFISPAATRIERAAASLAAALPSALSVTPQVVSGRMNAAEGALTVAANAAAGPLSAGQWGGSRLMNILGDAAVNVGAQAVAEAVPAIVPGGAQFDPAQVWKNLAYGAAMGTMFGVVNSKPITGPGERSVLGARPSDPNLASAAQPSAAGAGAGTKSKVVEIVQDVEKTIYGKTTLPDDATPEQAREHLASLRNMPADPTKPSADALASIANLSSITTDADGNIMAFSDQYRSSDPETVGQKIAVDYERDIYASSLASMYASNPEALARALDLEIAPGELTPENAQQVLAAKIKNEWLIQPVEGKGIAGVEARLRQAGMETPVPTAPVQAGYPPSVILGENGQPMQAPPSTLPRPLLLEATKAVGPLSPSVGMREQFPYPLPRTSFESAQALQQNPPTQIAGLLPDAEIGPFNSVLIPRAGGPMQAPESTLFPRKAEEVVNVADQRLESAKVVAEQNGMDVADILVPNSVEAKIHEAEQSGVPKEEAKATVADQVESNPDSFTLTPSEKQAVSEPAEAAIAGEPVAAQPKPKRPRKARTVAKTESDAVVLETLEGPTGTDESVIEYKEQTARPGTEVGDEEITRVASVVRSMSSLLESAKQLVEAGRIQSKQEMRAAGKKGKGKEIGRQTFRTAVKQFNVIEGIFGEGAEVTIHPSDHGGRYPVQEVQLANLAGIPVRAFRIAVHRGETSFAKGLLSITKGAGENTFFVSMRMTPEVKQRFATTYEFMAKQDVDPAVKAESQAISEQAEVRRVNEKAYDDLQEVFAEETDRNAMLTARGIDVPDGVEVEASSEMFNAGDEAGDFNPSDMGGFAQESKLKESAAAQWRIGYKPKLAAAVKFLQRHLDNQGYTAEDNIKIADLEYYIMSKTAPGKMRQISESYVDNTMPSSVRDILDEEFEAIGTSDGIGKTPLDNLIKHNSLIDDGWFDDLYERYFPNFEQAMMSAANISSRIGVEEPLDIIRLVRWDNAGPTSADKARVVAQFNEGSRTPVQFDEAKATEIREKLNKSLMSDGTVYEAYDTLVNWVNNQRGSEAVKTLMNENMMGKGRAYKLNLRNLPLLRSMAITAAMFTLDEGVDLIEEDETYMGFMPGSTLKKLFGNGEAGSYALISGGFVSGMKASQQVGAKQGMRARLGNSVRRMVQSRSGGLLESPIVSYASMDAAKQSEAADLWMAENRPGFKPGTEAYNQEKAGKINAEDVTAVKGMRLKNALDFIAKDKSKGTMGTISDLVNDINLVGSKSQFVQDFIVKPYNSTQAQVRQLMKKVENELIAIPSYIKKYKKDASFWDAFWAMDYRMSELEVGLRDAPRSIIDDARIEVENDIKNKFFTKQDGTINEEKWRDFNDLQTRLDVVRGEHMRALVAKSLGVNSWNIESHYAELISTKDKLNEALGAAKEGYDVDKQRLDYLKQQYATMTAQMGEDGAKQAMPAFEESKKMLQKAVSDHKRNISKFQYELDRVNRSVSKIDALDEAIVKSTQNRYMFRLRDNSAPLVLRIEFNPETGIPSVRREYNSMSDAKMGKAEILRGAAEKVQATSPEYAALLEKKKRITDRLEVLDSTEELTPEMDLEYNALTAELDKMSGLKPVSEMSDAEVFRFANDYEQLGLDATIRDMRNRPSIRKGSNAATRIIDLVMGSTEPIKAQVLSRSTDSGALLRPETNAPEYVPGKGNAALFDNSGSGQVMMTQGDGVPKISDLVDAIDDLIDEPVDRRQLEELIEKFYTYRDKSTRANGTTVETMWIDMAAMRKLVEAYTDPYIPNLTRRNNWVGYYNPDGNWTTKQRIDYTIKSLEAMQSQIQNYNNITSLRKSVQDANDYLDKWDINNGTREYVNGLQAYNDNYFKGGLADVINNVEMSIRRGVSIGTLALNFGSALGNWVAGASIATTHGFQNASTKYGVYETKADGTRGPVKWMPSEAAAQAELYARQQEGKGIWNIAEGFTARPYYNPKAYGLGVAAIFAPEMTLKYLAGKDGYGKVPSSQYGKWAMVYDQVNKANLQKGGVVGSYTVREGINRQGRAEKAQEYLGKLTDYVESRNNYSSILMSGLNIENKFGLFDADWASMNTAQKSDAAKTALAPYHKRLEQATRGREIMQKDIDNIQKQIDEIADAPGREQERIRLQKQLESKQQRMATLGDEKQILLDAMTDYITFNRGYEQGNWDKLSKSKFERFIESVPLGKLSLTMTAPILRSFNAWAGMMRTAGRTEGGRGAKIGRAAAPLLGGAILTTLFGYNANPVTTEGGIFLTDMAALGEMLYAYLNEEDGEKLDKVSKSQAWEDMAADMAPRYGIDPAAARRYVRAVWSEGLVRTLFDVNINVGAGVWDITGGGVPAQVITSNAKSVYNAVADIAANSGAATPYDYLYKMSSGLPTSMKRITQTALQTIPATMGGFGAVKVDKMGQPIYDKNNKMQPLDGLDIVRNTFVGKPWSETRSKLVMYEGGTPLYTENDRIAWANSLASTKHVQFGKSSKQALQGKGTAEQTNAALFERDAERLQPLISQRYKEIKAQADAAKNVINTMYRDNSPMPLTKDGSKTMPFREILSITAAGGTKAETEIKGSAPDEIRKSMLNSIDEWARANAAKQAIKEFYGGAVDVTSSEDLRKSPTGDIFALKKLGARFGNAYRDYQARQLGRRRLGE